ncbi:unnamed protein product [Prorocentrum cordatum]|uniref:Uncharacterized protein n=1 Tax=Prorocentrum cordatum TaxID=2364126 RepID=A0ABN9QHU8_9DINO|nr:unnamed protein product [Polarella glacialis]
MSWAPAQRRSRSPRGRAATDDGSTLNSAASEAAGLRRSPPGLLGGILYVFGEGAAQLSEGRGPSELSEKARPSSLSPPGSPPTNVVKTQSGATVPMLSLGPASSFLEHASWMLQSAVGCWGKADAQFESVEDIDIWGTKDDPQARAQRRRGAGRQAEARKQAAYPGRGPHDKRSVMMAVIVALALDDEDSVCHLFRELRDYRLEGEFVQLLESALGPAAHGDGAEDTEGGAAGGARETDRGGSQPRDDWCEWQPEEGWGGGWQRRLGDEERTGPPRAGGRPAGGRRQPPCALGGGASPQGAEAGRRSRRRRRQRAAWARIEGIELDLIHSAEGQIVPVVGLEKVSVFHENVSWILQLATGTTGKADSVYEYTADQEISDWCFRKGLPDQGVSIVRLKARHMRHVKAVGIGAKRSLILALVVSLILNQE